MGNGLDTNDKVALSVNIPIIVLAIVLGIVAYFTIKLLKHQTIRILLLRDKNIGQRINKDGKLETYNKTIVQVLVGDDIFMAYKQMLMEKYGGRLPSPEEIEDIISPETIFLEIYSNMKEK